MPAIVLIGMMGSGKTTVGRMLAEQMNVPFKDTDKLLQAKLGRPIHQLFQLLGEETFREHETRLVQSLEAEDCVLSTGGGTPSIEANWPELKRLGTTVFLDVDMEVLKDRLSTAKKRRPLIEFSDWEDRLDDILAKRRPMYERADVVLRLHGEDATTVAGIVRRAIGQ